MTDQGSNNPPPKMKLSPAMIKALRSYRDGRPWSHLRGRSMFGGSEQTMRALIQRGLLNGDGTELTEEGRDQVSLHAK